MNQSYCPSPMKNCLMMMTLLEKTDVKYLSNDLPKYLPSGVGGLGFLGCSGGFLGFIDSSISFSLSAAAFSFISKSFRLFSTLIFSFVANSLRKKISYFADLHNSGYAGPGSRDLLLTVFYPV